MRIDPIKIIRIELDWPTLRLLAQTPRPVAFIKIIRINSECEITLVQQLTYVGCLS